MITRLLVSDNDAMLRFVREHCQSQTIGDDGLHAPDCAGCAKLFRVVLDFILAIAPTTAPGTAAHAIYSALRGEGCLGRSQDDEPVFTLVARDATASMAVRRWAETLRVKVGVSEKVTSAMDQSFAMDDWRAAHGGGKLPD